MLLTRHNSLFDLLGRMHLFDQKRIEPLPRHYEGLGEFLPQVAQLERAMLRVERYWKSFEPVILDPETRREFFASGWRVTMSSVTERIAVDIEAIRSTHTTVRRSHEVMRVPSAEPPRGVSAFTGVFLLKRTCWVLFLWFNNFAAVLGNMRQAMNLHHTTVDLNRLRLEAHSRTTSPRLSWPTRLTGMFTRRWRRLRRPSCAACTRMRIFRRSCATLSCALRWRLRTSQGLSNVQSKASAFMMSPRSKWSTS